MRKTNIDFDKQNDVLYISFGDPRPSYSVTHEEGVYIRYDMDTDELSGITIVDFTKKSKSLKDMNLPGNFDFIEMNNSLQ